MSSNNVYIISNEVRECIYLFHTCIHKSLFASIGINFPDNLALQSFKIQIFSSFEMTQHKYNFSIIILKTTRHSKNVFGHKTCFLLFCSLPNFPLQDTFTELRKQNRIQRHNFT
jgi:hypothetical protein